MTKLLPTLLTRLLLKFHSGKLTKNEAYYGSKVYSLIDF